MSRSASRAIPTAGTQPRRPRAGDTECVHPACEKAPQSHFSFPIPLCSEHMIQIVTRSSEIMQTLRDERARRTPRQMAPSRRPDSHAPLVYYLRFGDRIKIGTSTNLKERLTCIPHDELLATEIGSHGTEHVRHLEFASDRITGEWFHASPRLIAHIEALQSSTRSEGA
ncbi:hypothetical protein KNT98_gp83 [Gordonia phage Frokostdame]|uniref:GIY-YIG nuclease family protein n=1 Tax=Gordonia phage Frokostdame TaxID=2250320 RepID=A0A345L373_9CAUD|nr:hypothetical protein KNT98_gp83 [Gordonia phage Frokostdame]AXH49725.1 hypothetical protein SEA_FROKOSTDAME_83 [Gordonia phage Frokostdame]